MTPTAYNTKPTNAKRRALQRRHRAENEARKKLKTEQRTGDAKAVPLRAGFPATSKPPNIYVLDQDTKEQVFACKITESKDLTNIDCKECYGNVFQYFQNDQVYHYAVKL